MQNVARAFRAVGRGVPPSRIYLFRKNMVRTGWGNFALKRPRGGPDRLHGRGKRQLSEQLNAHSEELNATMRHHGTELVAFTLGSDLIFPRMPCPHVSCDVLPITSRTKSHRSSYLLRDMSLYAVNLATPTIQTAPMGPAARPSYIRRSVQFSDIIIYENWTTDGMGRESRTLPPVMMAAPPLLVHQRCLTIGSLFGLAMSNGGKASQDSIFAHDAQCRRFAFSRECAVSEQFPLPEQFQDVFILT